MKLKPGSTAYRLTNKSRASEGRKSPQRQAARKRGQVGETYRDRAAYQKQREKAADGKASVFGRVRDFFLGPKLPVVHSADAAFINKGFTPDKILNQVVENGNKTYNSLAESDAYISDLDAIIASTTPKSR